MTKKIPHIIFQTSHLNRDKIPDLIGEYAEGYDVQFFNDKQCLEFLEKHFKNNVISTYKNIEMGAHRADLWRYCILYIQGGVYLDIKTVLKHKLKDIFKNYNDKPTWYTVYSNVVSKGSPPHIYQGIIATPPRNPIFLELIDFIIKNPKPKSSYNLYTENMYDVINKMYKTRVKGAGILQCDTSKLVLLEERCTIKGLGTGECIKGNFNKLDRTNKCCNIYSTDYVEPVFIGRDPNYPW